MDMEGANNKSGFHTIHEIGIIYISSLTDRDLLLFEYYNLTYSTVILVITTQKNTIVYYRVFLDRS